MKQEFLKTIIKTSIGSLVGGIFLVISAITVTTDFPIDTRIFLIFSLIMSILILTIIFVLMLSNIPETIGIKMEKRKIKKHFKTYYCVIIDFQTYVSQYEDVMVNGSNSLYSLVCSTCSAFEDENATQNNFKDDVSGYLKRYTDYRLKIQDLNPKKVNIDDLQEYVGEFEEIVSDNIYNQFLKYYNRLKVAKPESCEKIRAEYEKFSKKYLYLKSNCIYLIGKLKFNKIKIGFIPLPEIISVNKLQTEVKNDR